jgi:hypothetical protein
VENTFTAVWNFAACDFWIVPLDRKEENYEKWILLSRRSTVSHCPFLAQIFHGNIRSNIEVFRLFIRPTRASIRSIEPTPSSLGLM